MDEDAVSGYVVSQDDAEGGTQGVLLDADLSILIGMDVHLIMYNVRVAREGQPLLLDRVIDQGANHQVS